MYWILAIIVLSVAFVAYEMHNAIDYDPEWDQPWEEDTDDDPG